MPQVDVVEIPKRALLRQPEVCELAKVQPYVLRSWEAEFPDLGVAKTEGGPRLYRRADVERVLQLKHLVYVEGLTLAGARRKLSDDKADVPADNAGLVDVAELFGAETRDRILQVRRGLRELATMLARLPGAAAAATLPAGAPEPETMPAGAAEPATMLAGPGAATMPADAPERAPMLAEAPAATVANPAEFELQVAPVRKGSRKKKA